MAQIMRRIASIKLNSRGIQSSRSKDQETWKNTIINKERDKLLQEFLLAREELKAQFDVEKRELVGNYERRIRYLRRLLEDCDENINMLKLSLDAEKEENFILKTRIMELESQWSRRNAERSKMDDALTVQGYLNESYDKESTVKSCSCSRNSSTRKSTYTFSTTTPERSSIDGLKYSDRIASCGSLGQDSCFTSISTIPSTVDSDGTGLHSNCRKEFNRLLEELRHKQEKFDAQLDYEKERMREEIENEKLQLERVVYRQLNLRLEREIQKQKLLFTENAHLRRTISNAIMERIHCQCHQIRETSHETKWKENNSDSGADVEDNRSDDGSDGSADSGKGSLTLSQGKLHQTSESVNMTVINKLLESPFRLKRGNKEDLCENIINDTNEKLKLTINELNVDIISLLKDNTDLHGSRGFNENSINEMKDFSQDLHHKLIELEEILMSDCEC